MYTHSEKNRLHFSICRMIRMKSKLMDLWIRSKRFEACNESYKRMIIYPKIPKKLTPFLQLFPHVDVLLHYIRNVGTCLRFVYAVSRNEHSAPIMYIRENQYYCLW